ncbi:hypothetical protein NMY22_g14218 [Coprinellus aureogranulatus]|nr:hypothetical protein NMY22_g14218 [Coprinellus aureogranulatus]
MSDTQETQYSDVDSPGWLERRIAKTPSPRPFKCLCFFTALSDSGGYEDGFATANRTLIGTASTPPRNLQKHDSNKTLISSEEETPDKNMPEGSSGTSTMDLTPRDWLLRYLNLKERRMHFGFAFHDSDIVAEDSVFSIDSESETRGTLHKQALFDKRLALHHMDYEAKHPNSSYYGSNAESDYVPETDDNKDNAVKVAIMSLKLPGISGQWQSSSDEYAAKRPRAARLIDLEEKRCKRAVEEAQRKLAYVTYKKRRLVRHLKRKRVASDSD